MTKGQLTVPTDFAFFLCQVILWIKEQSDAFFPVKVEYGSLPGDPRELEDKLRRFKDAARVSCGRNSISRQERSIETFCTPLNVWNVCITASGLLGISPSSLDVNFVSHLEST